MKTSEINELIGREAELAGNIGDVKISVRILDGRAVFGRTDVLITPVTGSGEAWVSIDRLFL